MHEIVDLGQQVVSVNMAFTDGQTKVLSIIPHVTGPFSLAGSSWILYEVLRDRTKWSKPYHRILFCMCLFDAFSSIALGLSTWPIPAGSPGVYAPLGTTGTCSAQAFFIHANIAGPLYNFCLSAYYLLLVKYGVSESRISRRIEPIMHWSTIVFALGTSFVCLGLGMFNDSSLWCWINAAPKGCEQSHEFGETTCTRGDNAEIFRWAFFFGPLWAAILGTMVTMFMLWRAVNQQEKKASKWAFAAAASREVSTRSVVSTLETQVGRMSLVQMRLKRAKSMKKYRKSNMIAWQAFRYVGVFWLTWIFGTANRLLQLILGRSYFGIMALHAFFVPLQGFFNFLVYVYPRYKKWSEARRKRKRREIEQNMDWTTRPNATHFGNESTFAYTKRYSGMSVAESDRNLYEAHAAELRARTDAVGTRGNADRGEEKEAEVSEDVEDDFKDNHFAHESGLCREVARKEAEVNKDVEDDFDDNQ